MGKLKDKHNHALTQWLKVIIFGILMLAPFFSVLSRCLYVTCNKNAKDSYSDSYIQSTQEVTNSSLLIENYTYTLTWQHSTFGNYNDPIYYYNSINVDWYDYGAPNQYEYVAFMMNTYHTPSRIRLYYYDSENVLQNYEVYAWGKNYLNIIVFNLKSVTYLSNFKEDKTQRNYLMYMENYKLDTLDNAFEYSVNQLTQTPIFNWVQNTAIYTPVETMTNGLGFDSNNNVIALLLTYWSLLTAVYVVFDIIIACFVKLTHLIQGSD